MAKRKPKKEAATPAPQPTLPQPTLPSSVPPSRKPKKVDFEALRLQLLKAAEQIVKTQTGTHVEQARNFVILLQTTKTDTPRGQQLVATIARTFNATTPPRPGAIPQLRVPTESELNGTQNTPSASKPPPVKPASVKPKLPVGMSALPPRPAPSTPPVYLTPKPAKVPYQPKPKRPSAKGPPTTAAELQARRGGRVASQLQEQPPVPPVPPTEGAGAPTGEKANAAVQKKLKLLRGGGVLKYGMLGALGGLTGQLFRRPQDHTEIEAEEEQARVRSRSAKIARALEEIRLQRSIQMNQRRLAQANPSLYTSVMAGRRVPSNSVVLGGQPRMDLMKELAASMDSGRYTQEDPLSGLM